MLRREARLRKEFLFKKALLESEKRTSDKKTKLLDAVSQGKKISGELRKDANELAKSIAHDGIVLGNRYLNYL